jgi:formate dehydrogenase major subunit
VEVSRRVWELPVVRQVRAGDLLGLGKGARSRRSEALEPRTATADRVVRSICPYCAVGCGQLVFVKDEQVTQIEGDPDSPISRGRLCPKGSATKSLVTSALRETRVKYRRPYGTQWKELPLDVAMEMIADRVLRTREQTWQERDEQGRRVNRTLGMASLGGATLDNEENYLIKKLFTALGAIQIETHKRSFLYHVGEVTAA